MITKMDGYMSWSSMKSRCHNPSDYCYARYGGRGIQVCDKWRKSFDAFIQDVGPRPSKSHSIDRIDNLGNYEPGNVRWATVAQQCRNRRVTIAVDYQGEEVVLCDLAEKLGLAYATLRARYHRGLRGEALLAAPSRTRGTKRLMADHAGQSITLSHLAKSVGVDYGTLLYRFKRGLRGPALIAPVQVSEGGMQMPRRNSAGAPPPIDAIQGQTLRFNFPVFLPCASGRRGVGVV